MKERLDGVTLTRALVVLLALAGPVAAGAPRQAGPEATSLLGRPLISAAITPDARGRMEAHLSEAQAELGCNPNSADALIWLGRRTACLSRYPEAIAIFTRGIAAHPADARFYRHRGHRSLTVRAVNPAIANLERAAALIAGRPDEVEADGQPNARNIPTNSLHSNIWPSSGFLAAEAEVARTARATAQGL